MVRRWHSWGRSGRSAFFTVLALVEFVADQLPSTPARTAAVGLSARIVTGALSGACLAVAGGAAFGWELWLGAIGGIAGAFGGYQARVGLVRGLRRARLCDRDSGGFCRDRAWICFWLLVSKCASIVDDGLLQKQYDAIVIGSGQGGTPLSMALAGAGMRTALIERKHVGGTCINEGCTPTKTMVASGRVAYLARRAADYGVHTGPISIDLEKVRQRKRDIVDKFRNGSQKGIEKTAQSRLDLWRASFSGPKTSQCDCKDGGERHFRPTRSLLTPALARRARSWMGLDHVPFLDNISIMELEAVPEHLLVLGGGYIGLEFGQCSGALEAV